MSTQDDITEAFASIRSRLDTLASINAENIAAPGEPQSRYHQIVEEAYAVLGLIETQIDELPTELEYQHKRLDEIRDAALANEQKQTPGYSFDLFPPRTARRVNPRETVEDVLRTIEAATDEEEQG